MNGVTAAEGFVAGGIAAGIKEGTALDMALVDAGVPVPAAAVFTTSRTAAPPVVLGKRRMQSGRLRAVLLNSGCANAATGNEGLADALTTTQALARLIGCGTDDVLPCSTGPIGPRLPVALMVRGMDALVASCSREGADAAAVAIMTTDTGAKQAVRDAGGYVVGGMAKGAGMIRPDMATMLAVITTDAAIDSGPLGNALRMAVDVTFNSLNIDGCMSTNDTVVVLASGASGVAPDLDEFSKTVAEVCEDLAMQIARDAEGATRVVMVHVGGAPDDDAARRAGKAIADSALVRSSFYGGDPNWGRIIAALGACDVEFDPSQVSIWFGDSKVTDGGVGTGKGGPLKGDFSVDVIIGEGEGEAVIVTTDLTPEYVRFNGDPS